jgi:hypothetical protein
MKDVGIFYGHLVHFTVFCFILWTFGIVHGNLVYFSHFGGLYQEKSGNPGSYGRNGFIKSTPDQRRGEMRTASQTSKAVFLTVL